MGSERSRCPPPAPSVSSCMWGAHRSSHLSQRKQSKWATGPTPLRRSARKDLEGAVAGVGGQLEGGHNTPSSHHTTENVPRFPYASRARIATVPLLPGSQQGAAALPPPSILGRTFPLPPGFGGRGLTKPCFPLAMSPIGDAFRNRLRMFPSLINCCTIDWFQSWPTDALELVANKFLEDVELDDNVRRE